MCNILDRIVATKWSEIEAAIRTCPREEMARRCRSQSAPRGFRAALDGTDVALIAEIKKASPSKGVIREDFDPVSIAQSYQSGGAAALSVLTDATYFRGSLSILRAVRESVRLPVLRKEFILDPYQIHESRAAGADAVLLIASIVDELTLCRLYVAAKELGMDALVEVHTAEEMAVATEIGADLIGINNRDLRTFETRLETTEELMSLAPAGALVAALSGISGRDDVEAMARCGARAVLVGETLMRSEDIEAATRELAGG
ncbi:MAG TPA: indole-3-glycerol phosphate synthase TrpC [Armatimonadota bacterium]|nr:indole-3-glycerol phosphate synthase TrpC [Armatimonadota bacterium]